MEHRHRDNINNCSLFALYAGENPKRWKAIEGQEVIHTSLGHGIVVRTGSGRHSDNLYVWIRFEDGLLGQVVKQFPTSSISNSRFFSHLRLPEGLDGVELIRKRLRHKARVERRQRQINDEQENLTTRVAAQYDDKRRKQDIRRICLDRNITTLVHFTRVRNLRSILKNGLLGRSTLEAWPLERQPEYNDDMRLEGFREAICLSVGFPNYRMFYKYRITTRWKICCGSCVANFYRTNPTIG